MLDVQALLLGHLCLYWSSCYPTVRSALASQCGVLTPMGTIMEVVVVLREVRRVLSHRLLA